MTGETPLKVVRELPIISVTCEVHSMSILEINVIFAVLEKGEDGVNISRKI